MQAGAFRTARIAQLHVTKSNTQPFYTNSQPKSNKVKHEAHLHKFTNEPERNIIKHAAHLHKFVNLKETISNMQPICTMQPKSNNIKHTTP